MGQLPATVCGLSARGKMPNFAGVLSHRAVAGEPADARNVEYRFARPERRLHVLARYQLLSTNVRSEVGCDKIFVAIQQVIYHRSEKAGLAGAKKVRCERVKYSLQSGLVRVVLSWIVRSLRSHLSYRRGGQAEYKDVVDAHFVANTISQLRGFMQRCFGQQNCKFVSAVATRQVSGAQAMCDAGLLNAIRDLPWRDLNRH